MSGLSYHGPAGHYTVGNSRHSPQPGGSFSALIASMQPGDISSLNKEHGDDCHYWDEFGFIVEEEDGPEDCSNKLLSIPFTECPKRRLQWAVELELGQGSDIRDLGDRVKHLIKQGVPHSLRHQLWPRLLNIEKKKQKSQFSYQAIVSQCSNKSSPVNVQIEKDLLRTLPTNICFQSLDSVGVARLRRILRSLAVTYPDIGYCQGMGMIVATLLLFCSEEDTFWMMSAIIEDLLPPSYYSSNLWGAMTDQQVLQSLVETMFPSLGHLLSSHNIDLGLVSLNWFITLFASSLHIKILVRLWDILFYQGSTVMFRVSLAMLKMVEQELLEATNSAEIFNILTSLPSKVDDFDELINLTDELCNDKVDNQLVECLRRKHLSQLMSEVSSYCRNLETGGVVGSRTRTWAAKRKVKRSKSIVEMLVGAQNDEDTSETRCKNVRNTEMFVHLREAILRIGAFFQGLDPVYHDVNLQPDYSLKSHNNDLENFMKSCDRKLKRARAIIDFERSADDELGFCQNDIITIVSQNDDHCWVGELNGHVGWFPAKFVEMIDERSKVYSSVGDDRVNETITDLVRGHLATAIKTLLEQGLKTTSLLTGAVHPWQFIVDAANEVVESDYKSVFSRLVLCKTFKYTSESFLFMCIEWSYVSDWMKMARS